MDGRSFFSTSYREARERFMAMATRADASVITSTLVDRVGREGETLATDMAWLGDRDPRAVLLVTSGIHGVEGFAGSAGQLSLGEHLIAHPLPPGLAVVMVHAVNPYGFSHLRRMNEDNVDLNRNFIDFSAPLPGTQGYDDLHPGLVAADWDGPDRARADAHFERKWQELGPRQFHQAVFHGQHSHSEGLFFGGVEPTWSNRTLRTLIAQLPRSIELLAHIDIHTGLGPKGFGELVYTLDAQTEAAAMAKEWYGDLGLQVFGTEGSSTSSVQGIMNEAFVLPDMQTLSMTIEFGTVPLNDLLLAIRAENMARQLNVSDDVLAAASATLLEAFRPDEDQWMSDVVSRCDLVFSLALERLADRVAIGAAT